MAPDHEAGIEMEVRLAADACLSSTGEGQTYISWFVEPIEFKLNGITRQTNVETGTEIRLLGTPATQAACPAEY